MVQEGELALEVSSGEELSDTLATASDTAPVYGLVLTPPPAPEAPRMRSGGNEGVSFILTGLFILFLLFSLRFRNNFKYVISMFRSVIETRTRHNVFDDTVSETSVIVILNIMWCACVGIITFSYYSFFNHSEILWLHRWQGMLVGMSMAAIYTFFMWVMYATVGWIFSDKVHSQLWVKGYFSSQALMAPIFFLTALICVCRPETSLNVGIVSASVFILVKFIFIWKGYRIFFNQFSSWVLFLCYLCSLEIVPLVICYRSAFLLEGVL